MIIVINISISIRNTHLTNRHHPHHHPHHHHYHPLHHNHYHRRHHRHHHHHHHHHYHHHSHHHYHHHPLHHHHLHSSSRYLDATRTQLESSHRNVPGGGELEGGQSLHYSLNHRRLISCGIHEDSGDDEVNIVFHHCYTSTSPHYHNIITSTIILILPTYSMELQQRSIEALLT